MTVVDSGSVTTVEKGSNEFPVNVGDVKEVRL